MSIKLRKQELLERELEFCSHFTKQVLEKIKEAQEAVASAEEIFIYKDKTDLVILKKKLSEVFPLPYYQYSETVVTAAVLIFRAYECQFSNVVTNDDSESSKGAMAKLAEDAGQRFFNYFYHLDAKLIQEYKENVRESPKDASSFIVTAVYQGPSNKTKTSIFTDTLRYNYTENAQWTYLVMKTCALYDTAGYKMEEYQYVVPKGERYAKYGYRLLLPDYDTFYNTQNYKNNYKTDVNKELQLSFTSYQYLLSIEDKDIKRRQLEIIEILQLEKEEELKYEDNITNEPEECSNSSDLVLKPAQHNINTKKLNRKWWPANKFLIKSLYKRKMGDKLLVEVLHEKIVKDENRMLVIYDGEQSSTLKMSGLGGIGKTLTAKWYAHHYEKDYDHIIWINCSEMSIHESFKRLARDLDVNNLELLLEVDELAIHCYEELADCKCLWIMDNSESYEGIQRILPVHKYNFFCLITSRSGDYGKISDMPLRVFTEEESLKFLKGNLNPDIAYTDDVLHKLSQLIGNLPLALQLAVGAMNTGEIRSVNKYIEEGYKDIVEVETGGELGDSERIIYKCMKFSLDLIEKKNAGAADILTVFGYICPDDVPVAFFKEIRTVVLYNILITEPTDMEIKEAIALLLEFRLVEPTDEEPGLENVSIHPLLQQVIRHNSRDRQTEILQNILGCRGFLDLKLLPFTKYTDKDLQRDFSKIRAELLDLNQLLKLLVEGKYREAVELSRFTQIELKTRASAFNYAVCLESNGELKEAAGNLLMLDKEEMGMTYLENIKLQMGILLDLEAPFPKDLISGHLLAIFWKLGNREKVQEILEKRHSFAMDYSTEALSVFIEILNSELNIPSYCFDCVKGVSPTIQLQWKEFMGCSKGCPHNSDIDLPQCFQEFILNKIEFVNEREDEMNRDEKGVLSSVLRRILGEESADDPDPPIYLFSLKSDFKNGQHYKTLSTGNFYSRKYYLNINANSYFSQLSYVPYTKLSLTYVKELDTTLLPETLTHIVIEYDCENIRIYGPVRKLEKLILEKCSFVNMERILKHFQPEILVIHENGYDYNGTQSEKLMELTRKGAMRVAVEKELEYNYWCYYLFEGGRRKSIEFEEYLGLEKTKALLDQV